MGSTFSFQLEQPRADFGTEIPMTEVPSASSQPGSVADASHLHPHINPMSQYDSETDRFAGLEEREGSTRSPLPSSEVPGSGIMGFAPALGNNYEIPPITDRQDYRGPFTSNILSQRSEKEEFQDIFSELVTGTEHEIAFLTRHFSEVLGPWYVCAFKPLYMT